MSEPSYVANQRMQPDPADLMPDSSGINYYSADSDLAFLLKRHLSEEDFQRAQPLLVHMGSVASGEMESR